MIRILSGDIYRIQRRKQTLVADFLAKNDPLSFEDIDIETSTQLQLGDLLTLLITTSLFNPQKLVILRNLSFRNDLQNHIESIFDKVPDDVCLVLIEPKLDRKTNFGKYLRNRSELEEYPPYRDRELEAWLMRRAEEFQTQLDRQLAIYLIQRVGVEALVLENEIQKLRVYPVITKNLIDDLVAPSPNSQIFDLLDALMKGELERALNLYLDQRQQKNEPLNILGVFVWQLRVLLIAKRSKNTVAEVAAEFGLNQFVIKKARLLAQKISFARLEALIELCYQTDKRIRAYFVNPDEALFFFLLKGCQIKQN